MSPAPSTKTDIFGVCTAVGRDVGFHPDILRVAFAIGLFVNAAIAIGAYAALGLVVLASRRLFPDPRPSATADLLTLPTPVTRQASAPVPLSRAA